jgi:hypothetical protein
MINIRKLAAVDMVWLGTRVILAEYFLGIVFPLILGWISIRAGLSKPVPIVWETALGFWLVSIGVNYIPLFTYAVLLSRAGTVKAEGHPELAHAKRYGAQQIIILIPFLVGIVALMQEIGSNRKAR